MASAIKSLRLPAELQHELEDEFSRRGVKEWSAGVIDLLSEAVRMRRVPGVTFIDGRAGRRAALMGAGLEVWEVIRTWQQEGEDEQHLTAAYPRLTPGQLRTALAYYTYYPREIDERIARDAQWTPDAIRSEFRFASFGPGMDAERSED
jgi:uncharacterized protein (DUF433 family)